jgi:Septum formation
MTDETPPASPAAPEPLSPAPLTAEPPPPPPLVPAPPPAAIAKPPSKLRILLPLIVIGGFLIAVLWFTKDNQNADDLAVGTCFDVPTEASVSTVTKHACTEAHDAEVFHNVEYPNQGTYPISLTFNSFASDQCAPVFATYVGQTFDENQDLDVGFFYPTGDSWDSGDRTVTCYAYRIDGAKLTKSIKGSAGS